MHDDIYNIAIAYLSESRFPDDEQESNLDYQRMREEQIRKRQEAARKQPERQHTVIDSIEALANKLRYSAAVNQTLKRLAHHGKIANLDADGLAYEAMLHAFAAGYAMKQNSYD